MNECDHCHGTGEVGLANRLAAERAARLAEICGQCGKPRGNAAHWRSSSGHQTCYGMTAG